MPKSKMLIWSWYEAGVRVRFMVGVGVSVSVRLSQVYGSG